MARPRSGPPGSPFGAWLSQWFTSNPSWTFEGLAGEVGVTKSAVSHWLAQSTKVGIPHLIELARVTGEPLDNLERMVYGRPISPIARVTGTINATQGRQTSSGEALVVLSRDELEAMMRRAAVEAVRLVLAAVPPEESGHGE